MVAFFNLISFLSVCLLAVTASNATPGSAGLGLPRERSVERSPEGPVDVAKRLASTQPSVVERGVSNITERDLLTTSVRICVTLKADVYFYGSTASTSAPTFLSGAASAKLNQGTCVCVYAGLGVGGTLFGTARVYVSDNTQLSAAQQASLANGILATQCSLLSVLNCVTGTLASLLGGGLNTAVGAGTGVCVSYSTNVNVPGLISLGVGVNAGLNADASAGGDFSSLIPSFAAGAGVDGNGNLQCCAQSCAPGFIQCNGACYSTSLYTCPSGMPSRKPGTRRNLRRNGALCPGGQTACPVPGTRHRDCVDTQKDVEMCGGCVNPLRPNAVGSGMDCTAIPGANDVGCVRGVCQIRSCSRGFALSANGTACEALSNPYGEKKNRDVLKMARRQQKLL